jgi:hypothetical protein
MLEFLPCSFNLYQSLDQSPSLADDLEPLSLAIQNERSRMSRTVTIYCLDVSEGMTEMVSDPSTGEEVQKIALAKEYIQRKIAPKVGRNRMSISEQV